MICQNSKHIFSEAISWFMPHVSAYIRISNYKYVLVKLTFFQLELATIGQAQGIAPTVNTLILIRVVVKQSICYEIL